MYAALYCAAANAGTCWSDSLSYEALLKGQQLVTNVTHSKNKKTNTITFLRSSRSFSVEITSISP